MAELTLFGYRSGVVILYRVDVRFKLLFVVLISLACLNASLYGPGLDVASFCGADLWRAHYVPAP